MQVIIDTYSHHIFIDGREKQHSHHCNQIWKRIFEYINVTHSHFYNISILSPIRVRFLPDLVFGGRVWGSIAFWYGHYFTDIIFAFRINFPKSTFFSQLFIINLTLRYNLKLISMWTNPTNRPTMNTLPNCCRHSSKKYERKTAENILYVVCIVVDQNVSVTLTYHLHTNGLQK